MIVLASTRLTAIAGIIALSLCAGVSRASAQPRRATFDFTGDGTSDLLFQLGANIEFWDFDPGGVINKATLGQVDAAWEIVGAGDYNGDGTSDLLFRLDLIGSVGYWSILNGRFSRFVPLIWDTSPRWHIVGSRKRTDFNGDGRDDILWRHDSGQLGIYFMTGGGPFEFSWVPLETVDRQWAVVGTGDFNGDGRDDVLFRDRVSGAVKYLRMETNGRTWVDLGPVVGNEWRIDAIGDFDNDRTDDVYWSQTTGNLMASEGWWDVNGGSVSRFVFVRTVHTLFYSFGTSADLFSDGSEDLISWVYSQTHNFFVWKLDFVDGVAVGNGIGTSIGDFPSLNAPSIVGAMRRERLGPPPAPRRAVYDFTGDGSSDLLFRRSDGLLGYWDSEPLGGWARKSILGPVDITWDIVGVGDYDGDGNADILFRHSPSGAIGYWKIYRGSMVEFVPLRWDVGLEWRVVHSRNRSDFNGDGRDDILLRKNNGELGMYLVTGPGAFQIAWVALGTIDPQWTVAGTADFSGDGREDVLFRHAATGAVRYARMDGTGIQAWVDLVAGLNAGWFIGTLGDFNGDGFADIYWRTSMNLPEGYWDMAGGTIAAFRINQTVQPFPGIPTLAFGSGDYAGDRSEDLLAGTAGSSAILAFVDGVDTRVEFGGFLFGGWTTQ